MNAKADAVPFLTRSQIERRARDVLERHQMTTAPVDPLAVARLEGIEVNNATFYDAGLAGMIMKEGDAVTLLVNEADPPLRKRFTIAHELGHHFLHLAHDGQYVDKQVNLFRQHSGDEGETTPHRRLEIQANLFAAALLMPEHEVRRYWDERRSIEEMAAIFKVSSEAMGYRVASVVLE